MADPNQKLFSQIADLGRNINSLSESIKKNTSATESLFSATEKSDKKEKESATASNKAPTAIPKESEKNDKSIKDLTKVISTLLGEGGPLMSKIAGIAKGTNKGTEGSNKDFTNIAGGLKGIIKAFQEGGVAQKEGKYLVGENGPEVVKLPKGAGVIPINVKDMMEGLKKVPEFRDILKNSKNDSLDFFDIGRNPVLVDSDGKWTNLKKLVNKYEKLGNEAKDEETVKSMDDIMGTIEDFMDTGFYSMDQEVSKINGETAKLLGKSKFTKEEIQQKDKLWDQILYDSAQRSYNNELAIAKAELLATQSISEKKGAAENLGKKNESEIKESPSKLQEAESKKQLGAGEVVNPGESKKDKKGLFSKSKKEKQPEKVESLESLAAKEPVFGNKTEGENKDNSKQENKKPSLLSKVGKSAEGALFSAAGAATDKLGIASPLAKKGLGALKKSMDNKGKGNEPKSAENKTELSKGTAKTPSLVSDVKKLAPTAKNESKAESKEAPESKSSPKATSSESTPKETPKSESSKKSESKGESTSELGTSKDVQDIKNALTRIASILEGTLTVSPIESPFRPDSRRI
jgi:uncharacterized protein YoxC